MIASYAGDDRAATGRHKPLEVDQMIEMEYGAGHDKMQRYGELVRDLLIDQLAWVKDRSHKRRITEENGRDALALAVAADRLAHESDD